MGKKAPAVLAAAALLLGLAGARAAWGAGPRRAGPPLGLYFGFTYINLSQPPHWLALGPGIEWRLAGPLTIDPDVAVWIQDSIRSTVRVVPGVTANLRFNSVFIGGGLVYRVPEWAVGTDSELVPKLQAGLMMGPARLGLTAHLPGGDGGIVWGMSLATSIGRPGRR